MHAREVLQCGPDATLEQVRASYLRLAKQFHPDKQQQGRDDTAFLKVQRAWEEVQREERASRSGRPAPQEVDLEDMEFHDAPQPQQEYYSYQCRCGHEIRAECKELEQGINTFACDSCSLSIQVMYEIISDGE